MHIDSASPVANADRHQVSVDRLTLVVKVDLSKRECRVAKAHAAPSSIHAANVVQTFCRGGHDANHFPDIAEIIGPLVPYFHPHVGKGYTTYPSPCPSYERRLPAAFDIGCRQIWRHIDVLGGHHPGLIVVAIFAVRDC